MGNLSKTSQAAAIMSGALGMWIVIVMGYVRESARSPWLIYDIIPVPGGQTYPTPIPISRIYIVWFIILVVVTTIFWFVSKVTAHHPEKAEEV
jgi:cytochrome bd-type quinol oxidase subunit 1